MCRPIHRFWHSKNKDWTFHWGDEAPWEDEESGDFQFWAFDHEAPGTVPINAFWHQGDTNHTFHQGGPWEGEIACNTPTSKGNVEFWAYGSQQPGTVAIKDFWHNGDRNHTIHCDPAWDGEEVSMGVMFYARVEKDPEWNPDAMCDGVCAEERMKWLVDNQGMSVEDAKAKVKSEFPAAFAPAWNPDAMCDGVRAEERMKWLVDNQGMSVDDAKKKVKSEFPGAFGDYIDCKFPHTMSVVDGNLKIAVTPKNPSEVSMVAVHYEIDGGQSMNFDIKSPSPDCSVPTYVHVTPDWGAKCPPGSKVSYWLCANVNGLLQEEPQGACAHPDRRLYWTAR
jgi:hypothetical protein